VCESVLVTETLAGGLVADEVSDSSEVFPNIWPIRLCVVVPA
jgi:hypothetical protein